MVLFFIIALAVSILGMGLLLGVKQYELSSGSVVFKGARPQIRTVLDQSVYIVTKVIPAMVLFLLYRSGRFFTTKFFQWVAKTTLFVEHWLEKVLHTVREKTTHARVPGEASAFLREVADHKKTLLKRKKRAIFDK